MRIFSKKLRAAIGEYLSGEEHSDRVFEALGDEDDGFVFTYLRGSVVPLKWKKIREHFEDLDENELIIAANEMLMISLRQETLKGLIAQCKDEIRQHEKTKVEQTHQ